LSQASRSLGQWLAYQQGTHSQSIDLSLERVREVAARLGLLQREALPVVIVAGTNGKGSTATPAGTLLQCCGAGRPVHLAAPGALQRAHAGRTVHRRAMRRWWRHSSASRRRAAPITLTFFEYNALAALELFRRGAGRGAGAGSRPRRQARRRQHHRCRCRGAVLDRL
jgi:dihydrofolate synthase/folylpolyglutamate synthase